MSQENVDLVRQAVDAFNRRDIDAFVALTDDDVEVIPRSAVLEGGDHYHGHDGVRRWLKDLFGVFTDFTTEVVEAHDFGDMTLAHLRQRARGAGSEAPAEQSIWNVSRWRRGKCTWWSAFATRDEALEAMGLSEQDAHADS